MMKSAASALRVFSYFTLLFIVGCVQDGNMDSHTESFSFTRGYSVTKERGHSDFLEKPRTAAEHFTETERRRTVNKLTESAEHVKTFSREKSTSSHFSIK
ncbi:hypothetical protein [Bartonella sp. CB178]|uniref:hypothetical protein n=1 Tax=Bartonella sp. CB178 TaxID=3112255 RepID=UPI00300E50B4